MSETARRGELQPLDALQGEWDIEATHPMMPGTVVHGVATFEWLEGGRFLVWRTSLDHPYFPDSVQVIGFVEDELVDHYFDQRGVFRVYHVAADADTLRLWRYEPGFSQRLEAAFSGDGATLAGVWQLSRDDQTWDDDLAIAYRRRIPGPPSL